MELKCYKNLFCPEYDSINQDIITWIMAENLITRSGSFWNPIDTLYFMKFNYSFAKWCKEQDLKIKTVVITVMKSNKSLLRPHIDTPPARFKLSWPVLNAATTYNRWFTMRGESADHVLNDYLGTSFTDISQLKEIDRRQLTGPALIDAQIIHDVELASEQQYPRIGLQCQIFNEPASL